MIPKGHPCTKDCPERSPVCQKDCIKLKEYRGKKQEARRKKDVDFRIDCYQIDSIYKHKRRSK